MYTLTINADAGKIHAIITLLQAFDIDFNFEEEELSLEERKKLNEAINWADNNPDKFISLDEMKSLGARKLRKFKLDDEKI